MSGDQLCQNGRHRAGSSNPHSFLDAYKSKDLAFLAVLILLTLLAVSPGLGRANEIVSMSLIQFLIFETVGEQQIHFSVS